MLGLDIDTGDLKFYHQELPHDTWDFDSAIGEFVKIDRDGKHYIVHPNKSGFVFVYDRDLKVQNVWPLIHNYNFVKVDRSEDRRADRPTRLHGRKADRAAVPGDRRRRELEFR